MSLVLAAVTMAACAGGRYPSAGTVGLSGTTTVLAAASLTDAFRELTAAFQRSYPGLSVRLNLGPSSRLAAQLSEGLSADVFAAADHTSMQAVVDAGLVEAGVVRDFAANRLEIAVPPDNPGGVRGLGDLGRRELFVGLCADEVPCGRLARQVLENSAVVATVDTREPDVRSLLTKVEAGELDAGLVYRTDVQASRGRVTGIAVPDDDNAVTTYPIAPVARADNRPAAEAFVAFLLSTTGRETLGRHGFLVP